MKREDVQKLIDETPVLTGMPSSKHQEKFEEFLGHEGLTILIGLMHGARQAQYQFLANAPLTNMDTVARAAAIQGQIKGIETFFETLLEQSIPSQVQEQPQ